MGPPASSSGSGGWGSQVKSEGLGSDWFGEGVVEVSQGSLGDCAQHTPVCLGLSSLRVRAVHSAAWTSPKTSATLGTEVFHPG